MKRVMGLGMRMALAAAMFVQLAMATDYTVGSPGGSWDQLTDLQSWATSNKFMVGDKLIFVYSSMHDVMEVTKSDYESCTTSGGITTDASGKMTVALKAAGKRYFICSIPGHCDMGMKIQVNVLPKSSMSPSGHQPKKSPPPSPSPSPAAKAPSTPTESPAGRVSSPSPSPAGLSSKVSSPSTASKASYQIQPVVAMVLSVALLIVLCP